MSMTDPIADFLARIKNGIRARKQLVELPRSNMKLRIADILRDEGFVNSVSSSEDKKQGILKVELRYDGRASATANATSAAVCRIVSATTSEPCPASYRYTSYAAPRAASRSR